MARRARLSPARDEQTHWAWHTPKFLAVPASALWSGERRMEAENYLATGYGQKLALQALLGDRKKTLSNFAKVWQPSRLKGIQVSSDFGTPFLAATQVFDLIPISRKFLSLDKTENSSGRFIETGTIVVTCSGSVGRATLVTSALEKTLVSHDLLRVEPKDPELWGWTYAFLRSKFARAMMSSSQYGHIIKHLEPSHLEILPAPLPSREIAERMQEMSARILADRNKATSLMSAAMDLYANVIGSPDKHGRGDITFSVSARSLMSGRRRFEGIYHNPTVRTLQNHFKRSGFSTCSLSDAGYDLWLPTRFKRIPAVEGVELIGSANLFEINPDLEKRIADGNFGDRHSGRVKRGWLLLARSGQTYGLNGTLVIANEFHENKVVSDHVIRIAPKAECKVRPGYMYVALSHPELGRPMVKALAYGSSIPEIDVADIANLQIPRLDGDIESKIAQMAESAAALFADADLTENKMAAEVDQLLENFLAGNSSGF